jgi:hypothetical protein
MHNVNKLNNKTATLKIIIQKLNPIKNIVSDYVQDYAEEPPKTKSKSNQKEKPSKILIKQVLL